MIYFEKSDFDCKETGENQMESAFLDNIDELRRRCGFPFIITSGYRSPQHSKERSKSQPGQHANGCAADVRVTDGVQRLKIVEEALGMGVFAGIGVAETFVHVDSRATTPVMWTY